MLASRRAEQRLTVWDFSSIPLSRKLCKSIQSEISGWNVAQTGTIVSIRGIFFTSIYLAKVH
jgi:hypothetical protein